MKPKTTTCGWCSSQSVMQPISGPHLTPQRIDDGSYLAWEVYSCPGCGSLSLAEGLIDMSLRQVDRDFVPAGWYPRAPLKKTYPASVPSHIARAASEAHGCFSVGHYQAAAAMARATVEASAKAKGITSGNLVAKIDKLYDQHLIYEHVKDAAHEVRFAGNDAAHGDLVDNPMEEDEIRPILELMDMVLDGVFIAPAKTAAQQAARAARNAAKASGTT